MKEGLLISFIGASRGDRAYQKTVYSFPDGRKRQSFLFGLALWDYLQNSTQNGIDIMVIGTSGSGWGELLQEVEVEDEDLFDRISVMSTFDEETVSECIKHVQKKLGVNVYHVLLKNPPELKDISKEVIRKVLELDYKRIILDITHSYRFMPYVVLLDLMALKKLKDFNLEIYYGFLEHSLEDGSKPVIHLSHLEELVKLGEALSILENTGNFKEYFIMAGVDSNFVSKTYFQVETNRVSKNALESLSKSQAQEEYIKPIHELVIKNYISGLNERYKEDRMKNLALFFYKREQYLKAITLLYETILLKCIRLWGLGDPENYENREEAKRKLDETKNQDWLKFKNLRNSCVHGSRPTESELINAVQSEEKFGEIMDLGFRLFENLESILGRK
ncbi:TIGR02221 family CRISPR-associated protein [Thermocrinis sp.]